MTPKIKIVKKSTIKFRFRISGEEEKIHRDLLSLSSSKGFTILL